MPVRQNQILLHDMQRVVEALRHEQTSVTPYQENYRDLLNNHGKMLRSRLLLLFSYAASDRPAPASQRVIKGAEAIEMLHLATLVHDDVLDDAPIRRGKPAIQTIRGNKTAIYLGDLILSRYMEIIADVAPNTGFIARQGRALNEIVSGDLAQESTRHNLHITMEHYERAINGKTASLFRLGCTTGIELAEAESGTPAPQSLLESAQAFGTQLGLAFQIADDVSDFEVERDTGKPKLEDIRDGIYTLPVILALGDDPAFEAIVRLDDPEKVLAYFEANPKYIEAAKDEARSLARAAKKTLSASCCPDIDPSLRALIDEAVDRFVAKI